MAIYLFNGVSLAVKNSGYCHPDNYVTRVAESFFTLDSYDKPLFVNKFAREIATQKDVETALLEKASQKMELLITRERDQIEFKATLALLSFRLGRIDKAIELQKEVLLRKDSLAYKNQLQDFWFFRQLRTPPATRRAHTEFHAKPLF